MLSKDIEKNLQNKVLEVKEITKKYGDVPVLENISFDLDSGEIICILGPSGCGKTTLIRSILGMEKPNYGSVKVFSQELNDLNMLSKIGYMAQSSSLYDYLTGRQHLKFFGKFYKISPKVLEERIEYLADLLGLTQHLEKQVLTYSGGMKKRLAFAITLIHDPEIIILDEPTVGIDPVLRKRIWQEIIRLKNEGKSIIVTTHVMDEINACSKLLLLHSGHLVANDSPENLLEKTNTDSIEDMFIYYIEKDGK
ncbi:ABC transporter ATP-binding protein [Actinomyces sp. zg-332]|uniref:ABC transporter ATP-binding protein n=1 Tax=Actinomyces sp. zg-332 TaxID=2708340 RepID=UPI00141D9F1E|nr:ABC transporter ATP-binding protein [Actinomyces sp. zg-332]QPK93638.1 ABC transporter ATP-binding protein [Actinomyces sp. zg-332]